MDEEIKLASEHRLHHVHELQLIEHEENRLYRSQQLVEAQVGKSFRERQERALAEAEDLRVQKAIKEEGDVITAPINSGCYTNLSYMHRALQNSAARLGVGL